MKRLSSFDGVSIAYDVLGEGEAVLVHHGFASESRTNFVRPGIAGALVDSGRRVVLIDARGHGESDKPHDPGAYAGGAMVKDVRLLLDVLGLESVHFLGYSMGAAIGMRLAPAEPRVRSLVLGGAGSGLGGVRDPRFRERIAAALEASDPSQITDVRARAFRNFAEATKADLLALAAVQRAAAAYPTADDLAAIAVPTLVVSGAGDALAGPPERLAALIPAARAETVPGDHLSAVVQPEFRQAVVNFLDSL